MGPIGRKPIRLAWYCVVLPALVLNYAGQVGNLTASDVQGNPFFKLAPNWAIYPLVVLATLATIIASQAIITGTFSMTRQAMQLGWFPGVRINQTSAEEYGQIYVPFVNWTMMFLTVALVVGFGSSDRLAGAYGTAVSTTMVLTTVLLHQVMRRRWHWSLMQAAAVTGILLTVDLAFFWRKPAEDPGGRLDPADFRRACVHPHDNVAFRRRGAAPAKRGASRRAPPNFLPVCATGLWSGLPAPPYS